MLGSKSLPSRWAGVTWATLIALGIVACESAQPPAACGPLPQVTINAGERTSVSACFNDPNGDVLTYSATSSNPGVATASISGTSVTVTAVAPGNASVSITASDPEGLQGQQSFQVMVPNRPPQPRGTVPAVSVPVGQTSTIDASSYFTEPDGEALTYGAISSNPAVATVSVAGSTVTITAVAKGTSNVTVTATDPGGLTATQTFQSTVPNRDPEPVGTIPDQTVEVGETATVDVSEHFSDPDGDDLTYSVTSSNSRAARASISGSTVTITAVAKGTSNVTVTAADPDGLTATQTFRSTVPNRAPRRVGTIPAQTINVGSTATVDASRYFSDPDRDALTYTATSSNSDVVGASVSGSTVTITAVAVGSATITVTARDPEGSTATQQARVTVSQPNRAPSPVGSIPAQMLAPGSTGTIDASRYFSDPDGDALTYSISSSNSSVARVSVSGSTVTITAGSTGSATITVTARDPGRLTATQSARVTVSAFGAPNLVFSRISPRTVTVSPGDAIPLEYTIRNQGDATSTSTTVEALVSSDPTISTSDRGIGTHSLRALAAGEEHQTGRRYTTSSRASGTIYFGYCIRPVSGESNTQDNCSPSIQITFRTTGGADLEATGISPRNITVTAGISFQLRGTLRNSGSADSPPTKVRLYASSDATISTSDTELDELDLPGLGPSQERVAMWTIGTRGVGRGTAYLGFCIDAVAGESDTTNNCSPSARLTVLSSSNQMSADGADGISLVVEDAALIIGAVRVPEGESSDPARNAVIGATISLSASKR